jgi:hypothetical protein
MFEGVTVYQAQPWQMVMIYTSVSQPRVRGPVPDPRLIENEVTAPRSHNG